MINYFFLILILYYELLFKLYSGTGTGAFSFLIISLFSLSIGAILSILSGLTKNGLVNRIVSGIILFVTPVIYLVQYFVYRSFNVFYNINTMTNGAGQAFTGFAGDILRIVISFEGISAILLFFLPFFAFIAFAIIKSKNKNFRVEANKLVVYLGGRENIIEYAYNKSRLTVRF